MTESNVDTTSRSFREPFLAPDGYVYEREVIVRWSTEQRTSPFIGRRLHINDLPPDERSRLLADQHRNEQPRNNSGNTMNYRTPTRANLGNNSSEENPPTTKIIENVSIKIICASTILIVLILGVALLGFHFYSAGRNITSNYAGTITINDPVYSVSRHDQSLYEQMTYRYKKIPVIISTSGVYRFECNIVDAIHFVSIGTIDLYEKNFDPTNLSMNRLTYQYSGQGIHKNFFGVLLRSGEYILVVSVTNAYGKSLSVLVTGPASVTFS